MEENFVVCNCHGHAIAVTYPFDEGEGFVCEVSFWRRGSCYSGWRGFRRRIKDAIHLLRHGEVYFETMYLERKDVEDLRKALYVPD